MHTFYLMVGVDLGQDLPVLYNGREITKTGAKKRHITCWYDRN